jgi:O-antigen/teichoic acid export membrane protein
VSIGDSDFGIQVGIGFLGKVATVIVAFLGSVFLARVLGPQGYGAFYLMQAVVAVLDNPVTGWARACRKRFTEVDFPRDEAIGSVLIGIGLVSAAIFVIAFLGSPIISRYTGNPEAWFLLSLLFVGKVSFTSFLQMLNGTARFGSSSWVFAGRDLLRVLLQVSLVIIGLGVAGMVWGMSLASLLLTPVMWYLIGTSPRVPSKQSLRKIWSFARSSIPLGIVGTAKGRMDVILLGVLAGTGSAGNYEIALKLTMPAMFLASVASSGLVGRISDLESRDEPVADDVRNNLGYASLLAIPLFFGALTVGAPLVTTVYGNQYTEAGAFVAGLALFRLIASQRRILGSTINGLDRPELNLRVSTVVFGINVVVGVALFYVVGPIGVVVATVVSAAIGYTSRAYFVRSLLPTVTLLPRPFIHQTVSGLLMGVIVFGVRALWPVYGLLSILAVIWLGAAIYFISLITISAPFRETVRGVARDAGVQRFV